MLFECSRSNPAVYLGKYSLLKENTLLIDFNFNILRYYVILCVLPYQVVHVRATESTGQEILQQNLCTLLYCHWRFHTHDLKQTGFLLALFISQRVLRMQVTVFLLISNFAASRCDFVNCRGL